MRGVRIAAPLPEGKGFFVGRLLVLTAAVVFAVPSGAGASHGSPAAEASASKALAWLQERLDADGSLGGVGLTADYVFAARSAGSGASASASWLAGNAQKAIDGGPGLAGKVALAARAAGANPSSFGGRNLCKAIRDAEIGGVYDPFTPGQTFAMLGLRACGTPAGDAAVAQLLRAQGADGGWSFTGTPVDPFQVYSDTNDTALAIQALVAADTSVPLQAAIARGVLFLRTQQNGDGGFPYQIAGPFCGGPCASDPSSTAYVIQGLVAAGEPFDEWQQGGKGPVQALIGMQKADGSFTVCDGCSAVFGTVQAVPGLFGKPFLSIG